MIVWMSLTMIHAPSRPQGPEAETLRRLELEVVSLDAAGVETADFSNFRLDAERFSPNANIKMMAIMNAYNTAWDRIS